jgi:hypothetical protein
MFKYKFNETFLCGTSALCTCSYQTKMKAHLGDSKTRKPEKLRRNQLYQNEMHALLAMHSLFQLDVHI